MTEYYNDIYIKDKYSFLGSDKYNPIVKENVNEFVNDYYMGEKTIELAESKYQSTTVNKLVEKYKKVDLLISGDLQNQILSSTIAASNICVPFLGIYSACSTFTEGLIIASNMIKNNKNKNVIVSVSSHNLVSEKQFRFPVEYGALRKRVNTCTASGSVSALVSNDKSKIKIESSTVGRVCKTNHKDTNDMGSAMAPSCAQTLYKHLIDTKRKPDYYDLILTGDLGIYGIKIMCEYFEKISNMKIKSIIDCGSIFYKDENIYAGASGPCCLPFVLFDYILQTKKYNKILIIGTGSLHSVMSSNLGLSIPSVSHAVSLEVRY